MAAQHHIDESGVAGAGPELGLAGERELWQRFASNRDQSAREELVRRNMAFAKRLALRYRGASESFDDLLQVANLGLLNAVDRFDPDRGIPFTAFASPTILGELKRHFRDRVWTVRVPRGLHDRMAEVDKAITELTKELQRSPSVGEIAERLELEMTRRPRGPGGQPQPPAALARPPGGRRRRRGSDPVGMDRRRGRELRAGRGPDRPRRRPTLPRRARAAGAAAALRRRHDAVADRRADRSLPDARLADPAPRPDPDPGADQGSRSGRRRS